MESVEKVISFDPDYKGKSLDAFLIKAKWLFADLGAGLALTLTGGISFLIYARSGRPGGNVAWIPTLFFLGIFILLLCPLGILLTKINNGYSRRLTFAFSKNAKGSYSFVLDAYKGEKEVSYKASVASFRIRRGYAELKDDRKSVFILPFKALKEEDVSLIKEIAKEMKEYNKLRETQKK